MASRNKGFGIFGGLFDPPHIGHLIIAQSAREEFGLEKVVFVPSFRPPHKGSYTQFEHRFRMVETAIEGNPGFMISAIEREIRGTTYTIDVLLELRRSMKGRRLYLIIGADQWEEIDTWKDPSGIFRVCRVIVVPRPGHRVVRRPRYGTRLLVSSAPGIDISSTVIRRLCAQGRSIKYLTPDPVIRYIKKNRLEKLWR